MFGIPPEYASGVSLFLGAFVTALFNAWIKRSELGQSWRLRKVETDQATVKDNLQLTNQFTANLMARIDAVTLEVETQYKRTQEVMKSRDELLELRIKDRQEYAGQLFEVQRLMRSVQLDLMECRDRMDRSGERPARASDPEGVDFRGMRAEFQEETPEQKAAREQLIAEPAPPPPVEPAPERRKRPPDSGDRRRRSDP